MNFEEYKEQIEFNIPVESSQVEYDLLSILVSELNKTDPAGIAVFILSKMESKNFTCKDFGVFFTLIKKVFESDEHLNINTFRKYREKLNLETELINISFSDFYMAEASMEMANTLISMIKERYYHQTLDHIADYIKNTTYNNELGITDKINAVDKIINEFNANINDTVQEWDDLLESNFKELEVKHEKRLSGDWDSTDYISTGWTGLNEILGGGFYKGELIVLAAHSSVGKTTLASNFVLNIAKNKGVIMFFSLEIQKKNLVTKLLGIESGITYKNLRNGVFTSAQKETLIQAKNKLKGLNLYIYDRPDITPQEIKAQIRKVRAKHKDQQIVVIIDYLQLMDLGGKTENRVQEIAKISRALKKSTMEFDCSVIALSQLNRDNKMRSDKKPIMSDIKESGQIVQDSDLILFLHRENLDDPHHLEAELIIGKNRNGELKSYKIYFNPVLGQFSELDV
jgi:replicative DNA helicase